MAMGENPHDAPGMGITAVGIKSGRREELRDVAVAQKGIIVCILIQILLVVGQFLVRLDLRTYIAVVSVLVSLVQMVFVFLLSIKLYSTGLGILFGILALIPCIGLIVLLVISGKATNVLRANGFAVGLMGANLNDFKRIDDLS